MIHVSTTDEEFQDFVANNRELIEMIMRMQNQNPGVGKAGGSGEDTYRMGRAMNDMEAHADRMRHRTEEFLQDTYRMVMNPEVQQHFMKMGMEFMMAVTAMMQNAPTPDFMKESVEDVGRTWKRTSCSMNDECEARKPSKVTIEPDDGRRKVTFDDMDD